MKNQLLYNLGVITFNYLLALTRGTVKKGVIRFLLVPVLALLSSGVWSFASAATYNVRTDGSDSCNGSANAPSSSAPNCAFQTLKKAANTATAAGDKVIIQAGTYKSTETVTFNNKGTASAPITFTASGTAIIKGSIKINGSYIVLNGITVSPTSYVPYEAIRLDGQHNTLDKCVVTNYGAAASNQATAITVIGAYNTVKGCTIRDLNDIDAFHVFGHDHIIRNNYITKINQLNYAANHTDIIQSWGWSGGEAYNILVEGNLVTNSTGQLGNLQTFNYSTLHNWTFRNNIFANIGAALFSGIPKTYYYNNVFSNVGNAQGYALSLYTQNNYSSVGDQIINNVFVNNKRDVNFHSASQSDVTIFSNNYFAGANNTPKTNGQYMGSKFINGGDAKFLNISNYDFHIQSGSVLIDKGADLSSSFTVDMDGARRSVPFDIGSYEYATTISLNPPLNLRLTP